MTPTQIKGLESGHKIDTHISGANDLKLLLHIALLGVLFYLSFLFACEVFDGPSRRLCNLSFCLYHCAAVMCGMSVCVIMDLTLVERQVNMLEDAINWNQLQFFMCCNLITGLFNLVFDTYHSSAVMAYSLMFIYYMWPVVTVASCRKRGWLQKIIT